MNPLRATRLLPWLLLASVLPATAQTEEMVTDRPDQSESTSVVGRGTFQLETGIALERDENALANDELLEWGSSLLRYGLSDRFELRLGFTGHTVASSETTAGKFESKGFADLDVGFKLRLRDGDGRAPAIALLASTTVPVGDDELTSDRYDPTVRLAFDHDLADTLGLGWNIGATRESDGAGDHQDFAIYSASLGVDIGDRWGTFYELFGSVALGGEAADAHSFDTGLTYMVNDNLQLDIAAGIGISGEAPDTFVGLGISWRSQ